LDVSVCIVNWNCVDYLRACLDSLSEERQGVRLEVIVVDNASTDGAAEMVASEFPDVVLIRNSDNVGFARANNQAAARAHGRHLFFLNNDTLVPAGSLRSLVEFADAYPEAGMIGPLLRNNRGEIQRSYRNQPTIAALLHRTALLHWTRLFKPAHDSYRTPEPTPTSTSQVDVLLGAAVLIRRDLYFRAGGWDEDFRFGVEDVEFATRIRQYGPLLFHPAVEIVHHGRMSSRDNSTFTIPNLLIGYIHFFRKTGSSRLGVLLFKLALTCDAPVQLIYKSVQTLSRRVFDSRENSQKSWRTVKGFWHFLRHDLVRFWKT